MKSLFFISTGIQLWAFLLSSIAFNYGVFASVGMLFLTLVYGFFLVEKKYGKLMKFSKTRFHAREFKFIAICSLILFTLSYSLLNYMVNYIDIKIALLVSLIYFLFIGILSLRIEQNPFELENFFYYAILFLLVLNLQEVLSYIGCFGVLNEIQQPYNYLLFHAVFGVISLLIILVKAIFSIKRKIKLTREYKQAEKATAKIKKIREDFFAQDVDNHIDNFDSLELVSNLGNFTNGELDYISQIFFSTNCNIFRKNIVTRRWVWDADKAYTLAKFYDKFSRKFGTNEHMVRIQIEKLQELRESFGEQKDFSEASITKAEEVVDCWIEKFGG